MKKKIMSWAIVIATILLMILANLLNLRTNHFALLVCMIILWCFAVVLYFIFIFPDDNKN